VHKFVLRYAFLKAIKLCGAAEVVLDHTAYLGQQNCDEAASSQRRVGSCCSFAGCVCHFLLYNLDMNKMNKRAKKRLKESIEKDRQERVKPTQDQNLSTSKDPLKLRGFLPKPAKKRG